MSEKGNINPSAKQFRYSNAEEDDRLDGRSLELPKKSPQAALDGAAAQSPSIGNKSQVKEGQGGEYTGAILLKDSVDFDGPQTILTSSAAVTVTAASDVSLKVQAIDNTADGIALKVDGEIGFHAAIDDMTIPGDGGTALEVTGSCDDIFVETTHVVLSGNNTVGVRMEATSPSPIDLNYDSIQLNGDNATAIEWNQANFTDVGTVEVTTIGQAGTGGKAVHLLSTNLGNLTLNSQIINGDILIEGGGFVSNAHVINMPITVKSGAVATFTHIGVQFASLTVEAGATVWMICNNCPGAQNIDPAAIFNGNVAGEDFGVYIDVPADEILLIAASMSDQNPTGTDAPLQLEFGAAQGSGSDPVQIATDGTITINNDRQYKFRLTLQYGRVAAGGVSLLFVRVLVNGTQSGNSLETKLDNTNVNNPTQISFSLDLVDTDEVTFEIVRDSTENDSGGLFTGSPTLPWNDAPSASIIVSRGILVKP